MKRVGELLPAILDAGIMHKAQEHSRLFSTWDNLTAKYSISAAAGHSRVQDIRTGVLLIEADHPGWIQILQTKETELLSDLQKSFPELGINGIAFRLSKETGGGDTRGFVEEEDVETEVAEANSAEFNGADTPQVEPSVVENDDIKKVLASLGQSIAEQNKKRK